MLKLVIGMVRNTVIIFLIILFSAALKNKALEGHYLMNLNTALQKYSMNISISYYGLANCPA